MTANQKRGGINRRRGGFNNSLLLFRTICEVIDGILVYIFHEGFDASFWDF